MTTALLLALILQPGPTGFLAQVVNVSDGNTLTFLRDGKTRVKIRVPRRPDGSLWRHGMPSLRSTMI